MKNTYQMRFLEKGWGGFGKPMEFDSPLEIGQEIEVIGLFNDKRGKGVVEAIEGDVVFVDCPGLGEETRKKLRGETDEF
jgi:hypothetical protein